MSQPKILIIRLSSIGDILLTSPFIRQTRIAFPDAQIDYVVKKKFSELVLFNPHIDKVLKLDTEKDKHKLAGLRQQIKQEKYDHIFDLHNNIRSKRLTSGLTKYRIHKDKFNRAILVYTGINRYKTIVPIPMRYLYTGTQLGIKDDGQGLELFWPDRIEKTTDQTLVQIDSKAGFFALAPGAAHYTKRWPMEKFKELIQLILSKTPSSVILVGSREEAAGFEYLVSGPRVQNMAGKLNLLESAAVLNRARGLVSNDSGLMHMATAVQTPLVALFGSTVEELGFFPFRSKHVILENNDLNCRPCSHIGRKDCPKKHFKCMLSMEAEQIFSALYNLVTS